MTLRPIITYSTGIQSVSSLDFDERGKPDHLLADEESPLMICVVIHSSRYADSIDVISMLSDHIIGKPSISRSMTFRDERNSMAAIENHDLKAVVLSIENREPSGL